MVNPTYYLLILLMIIYTCELNSTNKNIDLSNERNSAQLVK